MPFNFDPSPLIAGGLNFYGQERANRSNRQMAREQMDFQERMSSTAYQRSMKDMELAGLNPILAYAQGGASTPSGASGISQNSMGSAVSSALDFRRLKADIDNLKVSADKMRSESKLNDASERAVNADIFNKMYSVNSQLEVNRALMAMYNSQRRLNDVSAKNVAQQTTMKGVLSSGAELASDLVDELVGFGRSVPDRVTAAGHSARAKYEAVKQRVRDYRKTHR